jgi:glyoxylase-like metal-dependent hydrolase (beta-lactamase superfamily II)
MSTEYRIGEYVVSAVDDHIGAPRETSDVYTDVTSADWDPYRRFALSREGKLQSQWRGHLVRKSDGTGPVILVDTGMGPGPYEHAGRNGELLDNLASLSVKLGDIDEVVTTHCHGDHIGWNVTWDGDSPSPTFSSAKYRVAVNDLEHYSQPENSNEAFARNVSPLRDLAVLRPVLGEIELAPGVTTLPTNGHTPGHQCVKIESGGQIGVITGDLFHNVAQVTEQRWCPVFDWRTDLSTASRIWLMWRAQMEGWIVFSGHLPTGSSIGRIVEREGKPAWDAV